MYAGHAALALFAKGKRPRVPLALLIPAAFAPDWIEWVLDLAGRRDSRTLSHSLVLVAAGATIVALVYALATRALADVGALWLTYLSHWPADFITGTKPLWPGDREVGLLLYSHPWWDLLVESALIVACWLYYRRSLPPPARRRASALLVPLGLIGMQIGFESLQNPSAGILTAGRHHPVELARDRASNHLVQAVGGVTPLARRARDFNASEQWLTIQDRAASSRWSA